jgi:signal transduction histidine kinase
VGEITDGIAGGNHLQTPPRERNRERDPRAEEQAVSNTPWQEGLQRAASRLARSAKNRHVAACLEHEDSDLIWLGEDSTLSQASPPNIAIYSALLDLQRATDIGGAGQPQAIREYARQTGCSAAVPVASQHDDSTAVLLLLDPKDPPGHVRPRTLAALQAVAEHMAATSSKASKVTTTASEIRLTTIGKKSSELHDADLQRLDRLASLGGLVAEIVHEVRNPMVALKTFLKLLPERMDDLEFTTNFLEVAEEEVQRIERLLNAVLNYARPSPLHPSISSNISEALRTVQLLLTYRASERSILLEIPQELPELTALISPDQLRQVALNLTLNAIEVTPACGRVRIRAEARGNSIILDFEDQGPGVPEELRDKIFTPFFSTKSHRPGGLGLGISRQLLQEAGGSIDVLDAPGGGSIFRVELPSGA